MIYVWAIALLLLNTVWLALVLVGLPGTWLMVACTILVAWWHWDAGMFHLWTLVAIVFLAALGELLEFVAGAAGAKRFGGTKWGAAGALVGSMVGGIIGTFAIPIPVIGSLLGACLGAAAGAILLELQSGQSFQVSFNSGTGAGIGRFVGTVLKFGDGVVIWLVVAVAAFWP